MRDGSGGAEDRLSRYVHALYFDIQRIDGVKPLEIWNGIREADDPREKANLIKNLFKIVVPLVNEELFGCPFETHARSASAAVDELVSLYKGPAAETLFARFPDPPVGDREQKELYAEVKAAALGAVRRLAPEIRSSAEAKPAARPAAGESPAPGGPPGRGKRELSAGIPDSLFDFREMRIVDNELPYIIFTDKEFRVIHGIALVYLWLIDLDAQYMAALERHGTDPAIVEEYRRFTRLVQKENPLTLQGKKMDSRGLVAHVREKLAYGDYLDVFENAYLWFEKAQERFAEPGGP